VGCHMKEPSAHQCGHSCLRCEQVKEHGRRCWVVEPSAHQCSLSCLHCEQEKEEGRRRWVVVKPQAHRSSHTALVCMCSFQAGFLQEVRGRWPRWPPGRRRWHRQGGWQQRVECVRAQERRQGCLSEPGQGAAGGMGEANQDGLCQRLGGGVHVQMRIPGWHWRLEGSS